MGPKTLQRFIQVLLLMLSSSLTLLASPRGVQVKQEATEWVITAVGTETAPPDLVHLMMKMDYKSSSAADATRQGEKQLSLFLAAVDGLHLPSLTYRLANNVITPALGGRFPGFVYTRNIIFTLAQPASELSRAQVDRLVAQLEDLGARFNSQCVTCIGSG